MIKKLLNEMKEMYFFFKRYKESSIMFNTLFFSVTTIFLVFFKENTNIILIWITKIFLIYFLIQFYQIIVSFVLANILFTAKSGQPIIINNLKKTKITISISLTLPDRLLFKFLSYFFIPINIRINEYLQKIIILKNNYSEEDILGMSREDLLKNFNFAIKIINKRLKLIIPQYDLIDQYYVDRAKIISFIKE